MRSGQRHPTTASRDCDKSSAQIIGNAFGMHNAAPRRHQIHRPRLNALHLAQTVAMHHRALIQRRHRRQPNVRMRPHIMVRTGRNLHRTKVIEKQERPDALRLRGRQQTAHVEAYGEFFGVGGYGLGNGYFI